MQMSDDARNVSAREWRAVREGETHSAPKTSPNNTPESFIVGVGASGALLAGAAIVFVTLVGLVSFNVWPKAQDSSADGNVELGAATTKSAPHHSTVVPVSAAAGQLASANVGGSGGSAGGGNGGGNGGGKQGGNGGDIKGGPVPTPPSPPSATPTPPTSGSGTTGGGSGGDDNTGSSGPVGAVKDPDHPVHPTHPSHPHQSTPVGDKGKDPGDVSSGDSTGVIGKAPFSRPPETTVTPPSTDPGAPPSHGSDDGSDQGSGQQSDSSNDDSPGSDCHGHGSTRSRH
jgi:hypothetical protein